MNVWRPLAIAVTIFALVGSTACSGDDDPDPSNDAGQADASSDVEDGGTDAQDPPDSGDGDGGTGGDASDAGDAGDDASDDGDAGGQPDTDPLGDLTLRTDGCQTELWGHWTNTQDWDLHEVTLFTPDYDQVAQTTHFETPSFQADQDDDYLFWDDVGPDDPPYILEVNYGDGITEAELGVEQGLQPGNDLYTVANSRVESQDGLVVDLEPEFSGELYEMRVYDDQECLITTTQFFERPSLTEGESTRLDIGHVGDSGDTIHLMLLGVDDGIEYTNYDLFEVEIP